MNILVSTKIHKTTKEYGLSDPKLLAYADLRAAGWSPEDAWSAVIRKGETWQKKVLKNEQNKLEANDGIIKRIQDTKSVLKEAEIKRLTEGTKKKLNSDDKALLTRATDKESKLIELQKVLDSLTPGTNEWIKVNQQIIEVSPMKKEEVKTEDDTIHYFLPIAYPNGAATCIHKAECRKYFLENGNSQNYVKNNNEDIEDS